MVFVDTIEVSRYCRISRVIVTASNGGFKAEDSLIITTQEPAGRYYRNTQQLRSKGSNLYLQRMGKSNLDNRQYGAGRK